MYVTQTISHGGERLHTLLPPTFIRPPNHQGLSLWDYNIHAGQGTGLEIAVQAAWIGGFDIIILTEISITNQEYCLNSMGNELVWLQAITTVGSNMQGVVGLVIPD